MNNEEWQQEIIDGDIETILKDPKNWKPVTSSNVKEVLFAPQKKEMNNGLERGNIYVRFISGGVYCYCSVLVTSYNEMMLSPSIGKYINQNLKGNCLTFKIEKI